MGERAHEAQPDAAGLARRQFLRRAAVAGAVVWVVPTMITVEPAGAAELTSPPPQNLGNEISDPRTATAATTTVPAAELPRTGTEPDDLLRAGLAAAAGGAALTYWSRRPPTPTPTPADPPPD